MFKHRSYIGWGILDLDQSQYIAAALKHKDKWKILDVNATFLQEPSIPFYRSHTKSFKYQDTHLSGS